MSESFVRHLQHHPKHVAVAPVRVVVKDEVGVAEEPSPQNECIHALISRRCQQQPEHCAVLTGRNIQMSYAVIENLSSQFARHLVGRCNVIPDQVIPICLHKSHWTVVAMLGILKANATFVLLEPTSPIDRLRELCKQIGATLVVVLKELVNMADALELKTAILIDEPTTWQKAIDTPRIQEARSPSDTAYIVFTSGSTGCPKGVVVDHGAFTTAAHHFIPRTGLDKHSRVLQFASYAFDVSIADQLVTLIAGGCICIPSEEDRLGRLSQSMRELEVTWANLTPSVARLLSPHEVPTLQTLCLAGEPMKQVDIDRWTRHVRLINHYGPAECAIGTHLLSPVTSQTKPGTIGTAMGCVGWLVNPQNYHQLVSPGQVGELLIEGSIVARGYIGGNKDTDSPFCLPPPWLPHVPAQQRADQRLYRTGDLVQALADGSLQYVGRKDRMVKINGQRIYPEEVESALHKCSASFPCMAVDTIAASTGELLIAFVAEKASSTSPSILPSSANCLSRSALLQQQLAESLPRYMIPSIFLQISNLPLGVSGKVDRQVLHSLVSASSLRPWETCRNPSRPASETLWSEKERLLRGIWSETLQLDTHIMERNDSFFGLGGNSLHAMRLVVAARKYEHTLTVADVFRHPTLMDQATVLRKSLPADDLGTYLPFSMLENRSGILPSVAQQCSVSTAEVEDIYPCTPLQEGLMALSAQTPGSYVSQHVFRLKADTDIARLQTAWQVTVRDHAILRTRIVTSSGGRLLQAVLRRGIDIQDLHDLDTYLAKDSRDVMGGGGPLARVAMNSSYCVITLHHALYDGVSLPLILDHLQDVYRGRGARPVGFALYIRHIQPQDTSQAFWESTLADCSAPIFPEPPTARFVPNAAAVLEDRVGNIRQQGAHTTSTIIKLAWALLVAHYTHSKDVVYGVTVNGRGAPVEHIDRIAGPTIATVPLRVQLDFQQTIIQSLTQLQQQSADMIPFEQTGLQAIRSYNDATAAACRFQSHLVVQPAPATIQEGILIPDAGRCLDAGGNATFASYAFLLVCTLREAESAVDVVVNFDPRVLSHDQTRRLVHQFSYLLQQLQHVSPDTTLDDLQFTSPEDLEDLRMWNRTIPAAHERCLHDLVLEQCATQPHAPAISAWDGDFTYQELNRLSDSFAQVLAARGVTLNTKVPLCLDRSKWAVIAILAVLRAGGTCVLMDPTNPPTRLKGLIQETKATLVLVSPQHESMLHELNCQFLHVCAGTFNQSSIASQGLPYATERPIATPSDPAFIVFTSGSTGKPKGIIVEHRNLATCAKEQYGPMGYRPDCRVLHFSSYTFDLSIYETVVTLIFGGCVCIPSETQRNTDLAGCMRDYRINWACFTPSSLRLFSPEDCPELRTLCVGGEPMTQAHVDVWATKTVFINAYGPAETCFCTAGVVNPALWKPGDVGNMFGGLAWITEIDNPHRLAAIGAVGELVVEGPAVARGYLNNPALTRASFIDAPAWLRQWRPRGEVGRLYRTGDLVQYGENGLIRFIGRRDTQVKLRGQRIELEEVEAQLHRSFPNTGESIAEVVPISPTQAMLVAFVLLPNMIDDGQESWLAPATASFRATAARALNRIRCELPIYMVPTLILPLQKVPLTGTGKINRRCLREVASGLTREQRLEYAEAVDQRQLSSDRRGPKTVEETAIHSLCAQVLNLPPQSIGLNDNFFHLGGDSISAMQLAAKARAAGIRFTARDVVASNTLADLVERTQHRSMLLRDRQDSIQTEDLENEFPPSPIQQLFFDTIKEDFSHFNQSFTLRVTRPVEVNQLDAALRAVVSQHAMLRARFRQEVDGRWTQTVTDQVRQSYRLQSHTVETIPEAQEVIRGCQRGINILSGPLLHADLVTTTASDRQYLFLVAHHLVMDLVSWRIILSDLQDYIRSGSLSVRASCPFPTWTRLQSEYGGTHLSPAIAFPSPIPPAPKDFWGITPEQNTWDQIETLSFHLDAGATESLYAQEAAPLHLYHTALLTSFQRSFSSRSCPTIYCEGHGREPWDASVDISHTVGWFTTIWPCPVPLKPSDDLKAALARVQGAHAAIPSRGWGYFTSRFTNEEGRRAFGTQDVPEIILNYAGLYHQLEHPDTLFRSTEDLDGSQWDIVGSAKRFGLVEVSVGVRGDCLHVDMSIHRNIQRKDKLRQWMQRCQEDLMTMVQWAR
ncbi:nonribosomal peptide synthetase [Aspergillus uvarum CBS 121591]|uniref:Nonribosomal peptide synthetase n=1 Tax=Aspergillus uvarum CBS 121591 TaxID=1448315 RepID=A0A319BWL3_9EURO|nr:nonribosomal peptide synthetase [Aspergillus uvarum CBS 121591]PYH77105.1 nonribosomal peptide synthetase [Aspergillus uvarum CBS 121591]